MTLRTNGQITIAVSSAAAGNLLPFQLIFTGTTQRCLPHMNVGREGSYLISDEQ